MLLRDRGSSQFCTYLPMMLLIMVVAWNAILCCFLERTLTEQETSIKLPNYELKLLLYYLKRKISWISKISDVFKKFSSERDIFLKFFQKIKIEISCLKTFLKIKIISRIMNLRIFGIFFKFFIYFVNKIKFIN